MRAGGAAALAGALALAGQTCCAARLKVNVISEENVGGVVILIGQERGYFEDEGLDVRLMATGRDGLARMNALAAGAADVARLPYLVGMNELMRRSGCRIVADANRLVRGKPHPTYYLVRKDLAGTVKTWADLKGRTIAILNPGSFAYFDALRKLREAGLGERDVVVKSPSMSVQAAMLVRKELDVAFLHDPGARKLVERGVAEVFAGSDIADADQPVTLLYYSGRFRSRGDAGARFMAAYLRAIREYYRMSPDSVRDVLRRRFKLSAWDWDATPLHVHPRGEVDVPALMRLQERAVRAGALKERAGEDELFDGSFLQRAQELVAGSEARRPPARR